MDNAPKTIYLQIGEDADEFPPLDINNEVSWCSDRVYDSDIEYVRADLASDPLTILREIRGKVEQARIDGVNSQHDYVDIIDSEIAKIEGKDGGW